VNASTQKLVRELGIPSTVVYRM